MTITTLLETAAYHEEVSCLVGSMKYCLPENRITDYRYCVAAKSVTGRSNPFNELSATQTRPASFFVSCLRVHLFSGNARTVSMVALAGQPKGWPVSDNAGIATPVSVTTNQERSNSSGDSLILLSEIIFMMTTPTQTHPKFIWLIAAVRGDMPTITATIHHIAAESEQEARRTLARDYICFFAGRIPAGRIKKQQNADTQATSVAGYQTILPSV